MPLLFVHAQQDTYTPPEHSARLYDAANRATSKLVFTDWDTLHAQSIVTDFEAYAAIVQDFLVEYAPDFGVQPDV